jgi:hypothetical protein
MAPTFQDFPGGGIEKKRGLSPIFSFAGSADGDIVTLGANTMTVMQTGAAAAGANTVTLTGAGDFNVTTTGGAANGINVNNIGSGAVSVDLNGAGTVTATGTGTLTVDASDVPGGAAVTMAAAGTQGAAIQLGNGNLAGGANADAANGIDIITGFRAGVDNIDSGGAGPAA